MFALCQKLIVAVELLALYHDTLGTGQHHSAFYRPLAFIILVTDIVLAEV